MRRLTGPRLILEPVTTANAAVLWRVMQGEGLREFQDVPRLSRDEFERRVAARPKRFDSRALGRFEWLLIVAATRRPIGWVSLRVGDRARGAAEIGYSIAATARGAGYASEATRLMVGYAFEESDLRRIDACCVPANIASRRLLRSLGFTELRVQRNGAVVRGGAVDIVLFELPRAQWRRQRDDYGESAKTMVIPASANPK